MPVTTLQSLGPETEPRVSVTVLSWAEEGAAHYPLALASAEIIVVRPEKEAGLSLWEAFNRAVTAAKGEVIVFVEGSLQPDADWLQAILLPFDDPQVGAVAGSILTSQLPEAQDQQRTAVSGWLGLPFADLRHAAFRKTALVAAGPLEPALGWGAAIDLGHRLLSKTSYRLVAAPDARLVLPQEADPVAMWQTEQAATRDIARWRLSRKDGIAVLTEPFRSAVQKDLQRLIEVVPPQKREPVRNLAAAFGQADGLLEALAAPDASLGRSPPTCSICGGARFLPGPGGRLVGGLPPRCGSCGSLERHRVLDAMIRAFPPGSHKKMEVLSVGEGLRKEHQIFRTLRHVVLADLLAGSVKVAEPVDLVIATSAFSADVTTDLIMTIECLVQALKPEGTLVLLERLGNPGAETVRRTGRGFAIGSDFPAEVAALLPDASVAGTAIMDNVTGELFMVLAAAADHKAVAKLIGRAQQQTLKLP